jgi:hypothetical protein
VIAKRRGHHQKDDYQVDQNNDGLAACMRAKLLHAREECTCKQRQAHTDLENQHNIGVTWRCGAQKSGVQCIASLPVAGWR